MRKNIGGACLFLAMFFLIPAMLLSAFQMAVLDTSVHMDLYSRFNAREAAGLTEAGLFETGGAIVDYLRGRREDLLVFAWIDGEKQAVFNERELSHMEDVAGLFRLCRRVINTCFFLSAVFFIAALLLAGMKIRFFRLGLWAIFAWLASLAAVLIWASFDFSAAFDAFHRLLFTNDLWMLNPNTDRMIRMMPEAFFLALSLRGAAFMGLALGTLLAVLFGINLFGRRYINENSRN